MTRHHTLLSISLAVAGCLLVTVLVTLAVSSTAEPVWIFIAGTVALVSLGTALTLVFRNGAESISTWSTRQSERNAPTNWRSLSRDQLDRVLQSLNEAIFFVGPDGRIQEANRAAGQLLECEPEALIDVDMDTLLRANDRL